MKKSGVTLIELLVVIVASGIILSVVMGSFASLIQVTNKIDTSRQLQKEINFALIRIADKMRTYSIDYDAPACQNVSYTSSTKVCLGDDNIFELDESWTQGDTTYQTITMNNERLFSKVFHVKEAFFFYVTPPQRRSPNLQPKLTVYLDIESIQYPEINFQIQTSISSRQYQE